METYNALHVSITEQYPNACRDALDTFKPELTNYMGPQAISAIAKRFPLPPMQQWSPLLRTRLAHGSPPELLERIKRLDIQYEQLRVEMMQMRSVKYYVTWMWGWAYNSPMRDYFGHIVSRLECFVSAHNDAVESYRTGMASLGIKLVGTSSATCPAGMSRDDWLLTIDEFQQLTL